ncbi:hypothetical protein H181DRAFT_05282 [Streptomyces sp. WMMB 714]|uniref:hypothetical protein n=1 Tax=Streptomyces sp. WMMB 714 TaxID=1286822 RepID=UPI000697ACCC|nr:hypothetical protein [Streptomyces sp. WMMB 714]SCK56651.1 hypothetical protein H181DRAFT_05282 [Streptomyces sp. WMMB 714]
MSGTVALRRAEVPSEEAKSGKKKNRRGGQVASVDDGRARYEVAGAPLESVGHRVYLDRELPDGGADEYKAARKRGVRSFAMWVDPQRRDLWARVFTVSAEGANPVRYDVYGGAGEFVGSATRERSFSGGHIRTRWSAEQDGGPAAVGYKGRWFWWCVWWLIFPVQCVLGVVALVGGSGDLFRMPRPIGYRSGGTRVLDYGSGMDNHFHLTVNSDDWDPRMVAALTALHCSHDGILGEPWDKAH